MSESAPSAPGGPAAGLQRFFDLAGHGTTLRTEVLAGITTFLTMAYILFVQPAVLSADFAGRPTGLDAGAVLLATALVAGLSSIFMGLYARYPIALAPGMGENFFFVTVIMALAARGVPDAWQTALGIVFVAGVVFLVLTLLRVREAIIHAVSPSLRNGIATGIGLFIAFIGLKNGGLIVGHPGTFVTLNTAFTRPNMAVFLLGLVVAGTLQARAVRGAILWGIAAATGLAALLGQVHYRGVVGLPVIADSAVLRMDLAGALRLACVPYIVVFVYMDLFDTVGTLVGVAEQADLMRGGRLPRAGRALLVDATGTVAGACMGTSTVTSYIESAAGVASGGRTGLVSVVTGLLFLAALVFSPLISMVGGYLPITASALVLVGAMMMKSAARIRWDDPTESLPAFLIAIGIPLTFSIADGLALGFITYPLIKLLAGRRREVSWLMGLLGLVLLLYFLLVRVHIH